ncbi:hypothetical protein [Amaricoccus sp.]|uniref:hypothetical protein n=1 Tax=Amaricoccus sp. TaxID=1872485 RepID=UPI001B64B27F|nr:hypothetical protein [Amaricoccus sp.]MBP7241454.1 hypothetical protein [Amaricoccus sp.]
MDEAATELRRCMADLSTGPNSIPFYDKLHRILNLPSKEDLRVAQRNLWGLSNSVYDSGNAGSAAGRRQKIESALKVKTWGSEG